MAGSALEQAHDLGFGERIEVELEADHHRMRQIAHSAGLRPALYVACEVVAVWRGQRLNRPMISALASVLKWSWKPTTTVCVKSLTRPGCDRPCMSLVKLWPYGGVSA